MGQRSTPSTVFTASTLTEVKPVLDGVNLELGFGELFELEGA
jgi:hypothetical protein